MSKTIYDVPKNLCTGCGACLNSCPVNAIKMTANSEGFLFPEIDGGKCVNCEVCFKNCPAVNTDPFPNSAEPECLAVCASDDIRMKSSSGGVFSVLAKYFIENDGYAAGVVWDEEWNTKHVVSNDPLVVEKMRGSKYVQSDTGDVYAAVKKLLEDGKKVLFTGCPCQVSGLNHFLNKQYSELMTIDIVCHGSPSPKAFDTFLLSAVMPLLPDHSERTIRTFKSYIKDVNFRNKERHGWGHSLLITMNNGAEYDKSRSETPWYNSFLENLNCRQSCGNCRYASIPRQGDITMGDFWGIEDIDPEINDGKGVSVVTVNNEKGRKFFDAVKDNFKVNKPEPLLDAQKKNWNLVGSSKAHKERRRFFELLNTNNNYDKITEYALKRKFDIGFIGWWYGQNYGSVLTNFALHQYLKSRNYSVLMIEWPLRKKPTTPPPDTMSRRLAKNYYDVSMRRTFAELRDLNWFCDTFILGSDQLWNYWSIKDTGFFYFLDFVDDSKKKIAYSTSFGHPSFGAPNSYLKTASFHMSRFDNISVRENDGVDICKYTFGVDAVQTMDPVFICDKQEYLTLIETSRIDTSEPYILAYILTPTKEKREALKSIAEKKGLKIILILDAQERQEENRRIMDMDDCVYSDLEIQDWLKLIHDSEFVFTDSYHGVCFSIIFEKEFACIANIKRGLSRFVTTLDILGLTNRMIYDPFDSLKLIESEINYKAVKRKLEAAVYSSKAWLDNALKAPKVVRASAYDLLLERIRALEKKVDELNK